MHEPGLAEVLRFCVTTDRLEVATSIDEVVANARVIFISVPTPTGSDGRIDLSFVKRVLGELGPLLARVGSPRTLVMKSTVIPGTVRDVVEPSLRALAGPRASKQFSVASNPEFLAEGSLVRDALGPARIVVGVTDRRARRDLEGAYRGFPVAPSFTSPVDAELTKYSSNAMLATRVSFANMVAGISEKVGGRVDEVMRLTGMDPRIGPLHLVAGPGFGGSCFDKDVRALCALAEDLRVPAWLADSVIKVNEYQPRHVVELLDSCSGPLKGRTVALLGLSFKANSGDVRGSRAYPILEELRRRGCLVRIHDPEALSSFVDALPVKLSNQIGGEIVRCETAVRALTGSDFAIVQSDWEEYRRLSTSEWKRLGMKTVLDTRRTLPKDRLRRAGLTYIAIGERPLSRAGHDVQPVAG